jgi:transcriptional regulator
MYIPAPFLETRTEVLHQLMREHSFATFITLADPAAPQISHVPLLLDADRGALIGHLARTNPQAADLTGGVPAIAIFHGPHAYVSPSWYQSAPSVPTWNYAVVHAHGVARATDDADQTLDVLRRTVTAYESPDSLWRMDDLPPTYLKAMADAVVAFEMPIARLEGKLKLSQNRTRTDRNRVIDALSAGDEAGKATAALMLSIANSDAQTA